MAKFLVTTSKGLENLLFEELQELGAEQVKMSGTSVWVEGDLILGYNITYQSRIANRVLYLLASGECGNKDDLYKVASNVDWPMQFSPKSLFSVDFIGVNNQLRNTQFSAQVIKDAIVDAFVEDSNKRPDVDKRYPDIRFQGRLIKNQAYVFLDFSGSSLHERGYREMSGKAPLKENLAAGIIRRSGWLEDTTKPLCDFFCGSGTLTIEAAQMAMKLPAQYNRVRWGFDEWNLHSKGQFEKVVADANENIVELDKLNLYASDINQKELKTAQDNAEKAGVSHLIQFVKGDVLSPKIKNFFRETGHIIINPPYGERLDEMPVVANLYLDLSQKLKKEFTDWQLAVITSAEDLLKLFKLTAKKKYKVKNGPLDCVLGLYEIEPAKDNEIRGVIAEEFQNRLKKNYKKLAPIAKRVDTNCYRVYDADLPNYNVAIDLYADHIVVQEYRAPKSVPEHVASQRLNDVLLTAADILDVPRQNIHVKTRRKQEGKNQYQRAERKKNELIEVYEQNTRLLVNLDDYLDTGLFLDHRDVRLMIGKMTKNKRVLNLFSYTCSVSVHAALGGAEQVTSVDLSNTYLNWGKDNFDLNKIPTKYHRFERGDCVEWLTGHQAKYDLIFIDPPTFSNSKRMQDVFDVQRDHVKLLTDAKRCLNPGGTIVFSNNLRTFKLDEQAVDELGLTAKDVSKQTLPFDFARNPKIRQCWVLEQK